MVETIFLVERLKMISKNVGRGRVLGIEVGIMALLLGGEPGSQNLSDVNDFANQRPRNNFVFIGMV